MLSYWLERLGSLMAGGGLIWAARVGTKDMDFNNMDVWQNTFRKVMLQTGPLEVCAAGIIVWLIAKWRRSISIR